MTVKTTETQQTEDFYSRIRNKTLQTQRSQRVAVAKSYAKCHRHNASGEYLQQNRRQNATDLLDLQAAKP